MSPVRARRLDRDALALDDLITAVASTAGVSIRSTDIDDRVEVTVSGRKPWPATVHARSVLSDRDARHLVAASTTPRRSHIVVADKIAADAKEYLATVPSWGWLDRRAELRLRHGRTDIEIRLTPGERGAGRHTPSALAAAASGSPIRGRAGTGLAAALLIADADQPPAIRAVARRLGMAPSSVSDAAALLRDAGLVRPSGEPEPFDLFWALAAAWRPTAIRPVATSPTPHDVARLAPNIDQLTNTGWAQGGDEAALAWGAPMFLTGHRTWLWVPDEIAARRAERHLGQATWEEGAAVIAVPPVPLVCVDRWRAPGDGLAWPTPHPLFLALDLAQDRSRGREILAGWNPPMLDPPPWIEPG